MSRFAGNTLWQTALAGRRPSTANAATRSTERLGAWKSRSRYVRGMQDAAGAGRPFGWNSERHDWLVPLELP